MPDNVELIAVASGAACVAGLLLAVVALVGTRRPPGPGPGASRGPARLWRGSG
ncbi:secretion system protein, partial [Micromonospora phytophila]|nr:secretion system protein [Micromonospora phytophila]